MSKFLQQQDGTPKITQKWHFHSLVHNKDDHIRLFPSSKNFPHPQTYTLVDHSSVLRVPLIFTALLIALQTWKCVVVVVFQNKIIYMPSMPPFARRERAEGYTHQCDKVSWKQERIRVSDGVEVALLVGNIPQG